MHTIPENWVNLKEYISVFQPLMDEKHTVLKTHEFLERVSSPTGLSRSAKHYHPSLNCFDVILNELQHNLKCGKLGQ